MRRHQGKRVIVSETQHGPVATDAAGPDAETGEADDVSEYSEEATGLDPAGEAADAASADGVSEDAADVATEDQEEVLVEGLELEEEEKPDDAREEFERELRMLPGDWYVVDSYAGSENRVKTNLESRIQSL